MDSHKLLFGIAAAIFLVAILALVQQNGITGFAVSGKAAVPQAVKIGYVADSLVTAPFFIAMEKGFFEKEGMAVEAVKFTSSKDINDALVAGRIDVGASFGLPALFASESVSPGKIKAYGLASETETKYFTYLLVAKNSSVKAVSELNGKKIAAPSGTNWKIWGERILAKNQVKAELVQMKYELLLGALQSGNVDAVFATEPTHAISELKGIGRVLKANPRIELLNPAAAGMIAVFSTAFIETRADSAKAVARALKNGAQYFAEHEEEGKKIYLKMAGVETDAAPFMSLLETKSELSAEDFGPVQALADFLYSNGELKKPVNAEKLFWQP